MTPDETPQPPGAGAEQPGAAAQRQSETHEDLAAVTRVLLGLEAPGTDEGSDQEVAERRQEVSGRRQRILDELSFLDD